MFRSCFNLFQASPYRGRQWKQTDPNDSGTHTHAPSHSLTHPYTFTLTHPHTPTHSPSHTHTHEHFSHTYTHPFLCIYICSNVHTTTLTLPTDTSSSTEHEVATHTQVHTSSPTTATKIPKVKMITSTVRHPRRSSSSVGVASRSSRRPAPKHVNSTREDKKIQERLLRDPGHKTIASRQTDLKQVEHCMCVCMCVCVCVCVCVLGGIVLK